MAPKRRRTATGQFASESGGSVTGGTGDIKPQYLTVSIPAPAGGNDFSVVKVPIPRIIMSQNNRATVMEILNVDWYLAIADLADSDVVDMAYLSFRQLRDTNDPTLLSAFGNDFADSSSFACVLQSSVETGTSGASVRNMPISVNLTDRNGNGVLVAVDQIFATSGAFSNTVASLTSCKILYRMVSVGITEYVGIVQSQALG